MNIFGSLLFLQGHVASAELARQLASPSTGPRRGMRRNRPRRFSRREPVERGSTCIPTLDVFRQPWHRIDVQRPTTVEGVTQHALAGATGHAQAILFRKLHRRPVVQPVHAQALGGLQPSLQLDTAIALCAQRLNRERQAWWHRAPIRWPPALSWTVIGAGARCASERRTQLQLQISRIALALRFHQRTGIEVEELEPAPVQCADAPERIA
jgi:hypothetical protein